MNIAIFANALHTNTLTGGDKIFVECAKRWIKKGHTVDIITTGSGLTYCLNNGIPRTSVRVWHMELFDRCGFSAAIFMKTWASFFYALFSRSKSYDVLFASSFFFSDIVPALIYKIRTKNAHLTTSFYIFTRKKWGTDYSGGAIKGFFFYINELFSLFIIQRFGSSALTASPYDKELFVPLKGFNQSHVMAVGGGVDNAFFASIPSQTIVYDAVFVGRFQPQKCVNELIAIWKLVVEKDPNRTLVLIGGGPQEAMLRALVHAYKLEKQVHFLGVMDGMEKAEMYKSSRIFVSASRYDSGNIALDEALACGLPGVIYDLPLLTYSKGVLEVPIGDQKVFCDTILSVLADDATYARVSKEAQEYARTIDWDQKAEQLLALLSTKETKM